jgi:1-acyl-sn-glycerol-3-phosphate acyltransferase
MNMYPRTLLLLRIAATLILMSIGALVMLCLATITLFQLRRVYSERIATPLGRMALKLWGIRVNIHHFAPFPDRQVVYVSNHTSTIDIFALIALGLPNTRFFLSGYLRTLLPLGLIGYLIGIFWTVPQDYPKRRREIFRRADAVLRHTGESVYLSPEGERVTTGEIGHFNKGAFHLATSLQVPIVPIFIAIPSSIDPGKGLNASAGIVDVYVHEAISTATWKFEDVATHKEAVRQRFVEWNRVYRIGNQA